MKALIFSAYLLISLSILSGCKQINKSIDNTFHPDEAALKKEVQKQAGAGSSTVTTTTSNSHIQMQNHEVIVNGDTLNTADMLQKATELFKNIDSLQKNKNTGHSKEMQQKVNEFLKDVNLQKVIKADHSSNKPNIKPN